jgi:hypothetical protein
MHAKELVPTEAPVAPVAKAPGQRAYMLTDHLNRSTEGHWWAAGVKYTVSGSGGDDQEPRIRCYASPSLAALMNAGNERFRHGRLWEVAVDVELRAGDAVVACGVVTTTRQVTLPMLTAHHHASFAVRCARAAYDGPHAAKFGAWADSWLIGLDSSGLHARALADELERESRRGIDLAYPENLMVANAAGAAAHAARVSWLAGLARAEEHARTIELATEVVRTALLLIGDLDLAAIADEVLPDAAASGPPQRPPAGRVPDRILGTRPA